MTFGKFGTYKRVEILIDAFADLTSRPGLEGTELVIAGSDSPASPGYLAGIEASLPEDSRVSFTGYVAEEDIEDLFLGSTIVVFPYTGTTGSSGPLHQAGAYARPVVLPRLGDFIDLLEREGFWGEHFDPESPQSLADAIERLLRDDDLRERMGATNLAAATAMPISKVVRIHVDHMQELLLAA